MPSDKFVAYYSVKAGRAGRGHDRLGGHDSLEGQRSAVMSYLNRGHWTLLERHTEDGRRAGQRPALAQALAACRAHNAALVVADAERLAHDDRFLAELARAGVECWAVAEGAQPRPLCLG